MSADLKGFDSATFQVGILRDERKVLQMLCLYGRWYISSSSCQLHAWMMKILELPFDSNENNIAAILFWQGKSV